MKKLFILVIITGMWFLSGCGQRYQVFTLLEQKENAEASKADSKDANQTATVQRVLVDTQTGTLYYFPQPNHIEVVKAKP